MKLGTMVLAIGLIVCTSVAWAKPREPADASIVIVSGGSTCPAGTTELYAGSDVVFRNPDNGNLTEGARCWQTAPSATTEVGVAVVGPCVVCRLAP